MSYPTADCRSCGAAMIWTISPKGRPLPLDARPSSELPPKPPGTGFWANTYKIEPEGDHRGARLMAISQPAVISDNTYVSHFETCPHARDHSKRGKR